MNMQQFILQRLLTMIPILVGITLLAFLISNTVPGDPTQAMLGQKAMEDPVIVASFRQQWGLDKPLWEQYLVYLANIVRGDLGKSIKTHRPVLEDLKQFLPASIELAIGATILTLLVGIPFGVISAVKRDKPIDHGVRVISLLGVSAPVFWLALVSLYIFYFRLGWLPGPGRLEPGMEIKNTFTGMYTVDSLLQGDMQTFSVAARHLLLPVLVLGARSLGIVTRMTRSSMLEVLSMDYIRTARGKGMRERGVIMEHALRNALIPTVTVIGLTFANIMTGTVLAETIFSWPGIGLYAYNACITLDFPAIMGVSLMIAAAFAIVNLITDVSYAFLDPRLRLGGA